MERSRRRRPLGLLVTLALLCTAVASAESPLPAPELLGPLDQVTVLLGDPAKDAVRLTWNAVPEAVQYHVQISSQAQFHAAGARLAATDYAAERLGPGLHFWRVAAIAADGAVGHPSKPRSFVLVGHSGAVRGPRRKPMPAQPAPEVDSPVPACVYLEVTVGAEGKPEHVRVIHSPEPGLEEPALSLMRGSEFTAGTVRGLPTRMASTRAVCFGPAKRKGPPSASPTSSKPRSEARASVPPSHVRRLREGELGLTGAKIASDLGDRDAAASGFAAVTADAHASPRQRGEAWVRLGVEQRALGRGRESASAFENASEVADDEVRRLLVLAVAGVVPGRERWERIWPDVRLVVDRSNPARPRPRIAWPGSHGTYGPYRGALVTVKGEDLPVVTAAVRILSLQPLAGRVENTRDPAAIEIQRAGREAARLAETGRAQREGRELRDLGYIFDHRVGGTVTVELTDVPWDEALDRVLEATGHAWRRDGQMALVARVGELPPVPPPSRKYAQPSISVDFMDGNLPDVIRLFSHVSQLKVEAPPLEDGPSVTIKCTEVPWERVLELVTQSAGLAYRREGNVLHVTWSGAAGDVGR